MSKAKDFSDDLADVSDKVSNDVDAILKIVRQKEDRGGDSPQQKPEPKKVNTATPNSDSPPGPKTNKPRVAKTRSKPEPVLADQVLLENVTTRLPRETNELLTEAALRQKLKKTEPSTRQAIVEAALQDWFRRNGYSKSIDGD